MHVSKHVFIEQLVSAKGCEKYTHDQVTDFAPKEYTALSWRVIHAHKHHKEWTEIRAMREIYRQPDGNLKEGPLPSHGKG